MVVGCRQPGTGGAHLIHSTAGLCIGSGTSLMCADCEAGYYKNNGITGGCVRCPAGSRSRTAGDPAVKAVMGSCR